jgi:hypothetical protein
MLMATVVITMAQDSDVAAAPEDPADADDLQASSARKVRAPNRQHSTACVKGLAG